MGRGSKRKSWSWVQFCLGAVIALLALHFGLPPIFEPTMQLAVCATGALVVGLLAGRYGDTVWEIIVHLF